MSATRVSPGPSVTRILRIVARIFAAASIVFGALLLPSIFTQAEFLLGWWDAAALFLVFGLPLIMGLIATWCTGDVIRRIASGIALGQLLVMATWLVAMTGRALPSDANSAWVLGATAIGATAAGLAWRARFVWTYLVATCVLLIVIRYLASPQPFAIPLQDALYTLMFDSIFAALAMVTVRAGLNLDNAAEMARANATREAMTRAQAQELSRVDAIMHDGVLATLLIASQYGAESREAAGRQARKTVAQITDFAAAPTPRSTISKLDFIWRQQATTTEIDPEAEFDYVVDSPDADLPAEVGGAFSESLAEALRNVLQHASVPGEELHRAVHVSVDGNHIEVMVLDDGRGFDPSHIAPSRLGIAISIRARMARLLGGSSHVVSRLGHGTRVVLRWERP